MIVSASRRTDIPACYGSWFVKRLQAGYVDVQNPMNEEQISRVYLNEDTADCFIFCTKNPLPMIRPGKAGSLLDAVDSFAIPYLFHFTLTPYGGDVERHLPPKQVLIEAFRTLGARLGKERMVWRYDPVVFAGSWDTASHKKAFSEYARQLSGYTGRCIVSFLMIYKKFTTAKIRGLGGPIEFDARFELASYFDRVCRNYGMKLSICCDAHDYSALGLQPCGCIDREVVETALGCPVHIRKEKSLRDNCLCLPSTDIGAYDSCPHGCEYCYAVSSVQHVRKRMRLHDSDSSMLIGHVPPHIEPAVRAMPSIKVKQTQLSLL